MTPDMANKSTMDYKAEAERIIALFREAAKNQIFADWEYYHRRCAAVMCNEFLELLEEWDSRFDQYVKVLEHINQNQ